MKLIWFGAALFFFGGLFSRPGRTQETVLLIGGNTDGYLSPCGCTKPMSGGIRRRVAAILALSKGGEAVVLENGGLVSGTGRQDELKAETMAESLKAAGVTAINLSRSEAALGAPMVNALQRLSGGAFLTGAVKNPSESLAATRAQGPFLIGAASMQDEALATSLGGEPISAEKATESLLEAAKTAGKTPVLMLDGSREDAKALATKFPALPMIIFRSTGDPPAQPDRQGSTLLVTPGERGKHVIRFAFDKDFSGYSVVKLGPDVSDDATAGRAYDRYLTRVTGQKLLDRIPRNPGAEFAGTKTCGSCHQEAYEIWKKTPHSHALKTLEDDKHGRDPDCVACHVVGLDLETGFRDRILTPELADVGCESCHGPGKEHSLNPAVKMGKAGQKSCAPCHKPENSPKFDFESYWARVIHK